MLKIALYNLTTTTLWGGVETFNREMAKALAKKGYTVHIYGGKNSLANDLPAEVTTFLYPYLKRTSVPNFGSRFRKFAERLSFGVFAYRDLIRRGYDYVYVSKPFDIPVALLCAHYGKARAIFGSGGTEFFPGYKYLVGKVDHFFACSEFNAAEIEAYCGIRPLVLPNGVDTALFAPRNPDPELYKGLGLERSADVIVSACRLVGWKGLRYSLLAIKKLVERGFPVRYLIIGEGEERRNLEELAGMLKVKDHVAFLGSIRNADLPKYYSLAKLAVFPSMAHETFGISIAEAMSCGVPVVSTRIGGIPEVVEEGTGLLVPPRDEQSLAGAMELLLLNGELRRRIGNEGRKRIEEYFGWDVIVEKFQRYVRSSRSVNGGRGELKT
ncbi:MAG TPA: glycosyltransferase family 4 protein [Thermodesulfovibrionales bacterium]|nr:glycosyltransferase family 4 protein [Thermodesulfovibrionales bacterium]